MRKTIQTLLALFLMTAAACTNKEASPAAHQGPALVQEAGVGHVTIALSDDEQHRVDVRKKWTQYAQEVVERSHDQEAKMVMDMVIGNLVTLAVVPGQDRTKALETAKPELPYTFFLSLEPTDRKDSRFQQTIERTNVFASYQPENRLIMVRETEPCSELWKGFMLLHEAHHAGDLLYQPYDWQDHQIFSAKERDVHSFQNRLMLEIGGPAYQAILDREVARIRVELKKTGLDGYKRQAGSFTTLTIPNRTEYNREMDTIFSPALSNLEQDSRQTILWIHANYLIYDQDRGGLDAESGKAAFMFAIYQSGGIFGK